MRRVALIGLARLLWRVAARVDRWGTAVFVRAWQVRQSGLGGSWLAPTFTVSEPDKALENSYLFRAKLLALLNKEAFDPRVWGQRSQPCREDEPQTGR
jgi:hypothetical protein